MKSKNVMIVLAVLFILCSCTVQSSDATANMTVNGAAVTTFDDSLSIAAGETKTASIMITNTDTDYITVSVSVTSQGIKSTVDKGESVIAKGNAEKYILTMESTRFTEHGNYKITVDVTVFSFSANKTETATMTINLEVRPEYSDGGEFNKIFGVFGTLPAPMNTPLVSALVTFAIWCCIAAIAPIILRPIWAVIFRNEDADREDITRTTGRMALLIIIVYGIRKSLVVYGAHDVIVNMFEDISNLIFIVLAAIIVWSIYKNVISTLFHRSERRGNLSGVDTTLIPLFRMIGKIVIAVSATSALLSVLGVDLVAILTGAGIVGIAISLGAQGILSEFFGGVFLLTARPFKVGDMVQIGTETEIYEVKRIGLLNCEFKNWANREHYVLPNSKVSASSVINVTGRTNIYRIYLYFDVDYDAPIEKTKEIILKHAYANKDVVTDDPRYLPFARLDSFDYSYMTFRLAVYIKDFRDNVRLTGELNEAIYAELVREGIDCPFEIYDVYIKDGEKEA